MTTTQGQRATGTASMDLGIRLLPTSVVIPAGWAIRLALAGADADTFAAPDDPSALDVSLEYSLEEPSTLSLPVRRREV